MPVLWAYQTLTNVPSVMGHHDRACTASRQGRVHYKCVSEPIATCVLLLFLLHKSAIDVSCLNIVQSSIAAAVCVFSSGL